MYRAIFVLSPVLTLPCLTSSFLLASGVLGVVGSAGVTLTKLLMAFCKLSYAVSISVTVATSLAATAFTSIRILANAAQLSLVYYALFNDSALLINSLRASLFGFSLSCKKALTNLSCAS